MLNFSTWKTGIILLVCLFGIIFSLPNLFSEKSLESWPDWIPSNKIVLGLDLQGGSHLLLEFNEQEAIDARIKTLRGDIRQRLREARIGYRDLRARGNQVSVTIRDISQVPAATQALDELVQPVNSGNAFTGSLIQIVELDDAVNGRLEYSITDQGASYLVNTAVSQAREVLANRLDGLGTTEPTIQKQGANRILIQVPGEDNIERLKKLLTDAAVLTFQFVDETPLPADIDNYRAPPGLELFFFQSEVEGQRGLPILLESRVIVGGEDLVDAQPAFDQQTNQPIVTFRFNARGGKKFADATRDNVNRRFAIVLDGEVVSAPVIREPILGGSGQISGGFTVEGANDLAIVLRAGALPVEPVIVEERTVGPSLGLDSVNAGAFSAVVGLILVLVFMVISYYLFGFVANTALLINIILIIGALSALQATLTLPGIAGIVLTMGMAVDANVLIFERIREEIRAGKSAISAIDSGYSRALGTILDANITTFIAAAILFVMGSGPVRGFAVTLAIGIITSVFTAFTLSRWIIAMWVRRQRPETLPI